MGSKREAKYLAYFVTKSNGFGKRSKVLGLLCHKAKYLAYFVTKSNGFEKGSKVLGLLCHKE